MSHTAAGTGANLTRAEAGGRHNAFDAVRLTLAMLVLYAHGRLLGGFREDEIALFSRGQTNAGTMAVVGFFGISGYLVSQSFQRNSRWQPFLAARALRILPGMYAALLFSAFVAAPIIGWLSPTENSWHVADAWRYVWGNALFVVNHWTVGDELVGLPYPESLNGPLWSLWPEVMCYAGVLGLGVAGLVRRGAVDVLVITGGLLLLHVLSQLTLNRPLLAPGFMSVSAYGGLFLAFAVGACSALLPPADHWSWRTGLVYLVLVALLLRLGGWAVLGPVLLPLALLHLALSIRLPLKQDWSYGVYLLHAPVQQMLAAGGLHQHGEAVFILLSVATTLPLAWLSWQFLERPALRLKARPSHLPMPATPAATDP